MAQPVPDVLELTYMRYAQLPTLVDYATESADCSCRAKLITAVTDLAPAYVVLDGRGRTLGIIVLPSNLPDPVAHLHTQLWLYGNSRLGVGAT